MKDPLTIRLDTPNYLVRTVDASDDMGTWCDWMDEPETARMLNVPPRKLSPEDFKKYVHAFDRINNHLLGIFKRSTGQLVGLWAVYVDWPHSEFLVNVIVGEIPERKTNVRHETAWRVNRYFFEELDLKFQRANTLATNIPAVKALEEKLWTLSARGKAPAADGKGDVELLHYTRSREVWKSQTPMSVDALLRGASSS
ncbi:MAG: GNAT family N-acetyltransferase [Micropepsaceae bacterium]